MQQAYEFLSQGGEMGALMRTHDWESSQLGSPAGWPGTLKTTVRLVLTSSQPMFIWWGPDLIQFYNDEYRQTMGPERHPSALGQKGRDCWQEIWPIIGPQIESIMAGGPATSHEDQLVPVTRFGKREDVWWTYTYSPIQDADGVGGVLVICKDVTQEHLAKEELRHLNQRLSEEIALRQHEAERLRVLFQQAPGFMAILHGPEHVFDFTNNAYVRLTGDRKFLGKSVREAFPELADQGFLELLDEVYITGQPYSATEVPVLIRRSASDPLVKAYIDFVYQPIIESNGAVSGIFVEGADVTERRLAQDALRTAQNRLTEGMVAARMTVWDWDLSTGLIHFSDNAQDQFGAGFNKVVRPWECLHPDDLAELETVRARAIAERSTYQAVVRFIYPANTEPIWLDIRGNVICDDDGVPCSIRGVTIDVTERKRAEQQLLEADRRKDEFLAMLAHELRNPLAPISAAAQLLKMIPTEDRRIKQASEIIGRQVHHMTSLVDDLLDVSRVTRGQVQLAKDLNDIKILIAEALEQVRPLIETKRHHFVLHQGMDTTMVLGDRKRLIQVIANLLNNAAKYTPDGGNIHLHLEANDAQILIRVRDDGIGIAPELLSHIFELFTQASRSPDRAQGGLGLGLALVKSLVELHGGIINAHSQGVGTGAEFTVCLPRHVEQKALSIQNQETPLPQSTKSLRILVVDDNRDAAQVLSMFLSTLGHQVIVEHDPLRALDRIRSETPDACMLDIGLPGMDGNTLAMQIRALADRRKMMLIAISGYGNEQDIKMAMVAGFDHYLVKPANTAKLAELLAELGAWQISGGAHTERRAGRLPPANQAGAAAAFTQIRG